MPALDKEAIKNLRSDIAEARKREVNFGVCLGKKADATVLMTHKSRSAEMLARQARDKGETKKISCGTLAVDGNKLNFKCTEEPPTGFAKILKGYMKAAGLTSMKVRILSLTGDLLEDDGEPDEDAVAEVSEDTGEAPEEDQDQSLVGEDVAEETREERAAQQDDGVRETDTPVGDALSGELPESAPATESPEGTETSAVPDEEEIPPGARQEAPAPLEAAGPGAEAAQDAAADVDTLTPPEAIPGAPAPAGGDAAGDGPGAGVAEAPPVAGPGVGGGAPAAAGDGSGAGAPQAAGDGPGAAPAVKAVDLSGDDAAKLARIETDLASAETLITAYMAVIPGSAEVKPAAWDKTDTETKAFVTAMKAPGAVLETAKLEKVLKDLAALINTINAKTVEKKDWKQVLDKLDARLVTLDRHPQAGSAEISPKIADIRTKRAAAVAKADKQDFKGATAAVEPLMKRCDEVELLADDCAHYKAVLASRTALVTGTAGLAATGIAKIDNIQGECQTLLNKAAADAAKDHFKDAVKKLDEIPDLHTHMMVERAKKRQYDTDLGNLNAMFVPIDALPADQQKLLEPGLAAFRKSFADAKIAKTQDYYDSANLMRLLLLKEGPYFSGAAKAIALYNPAKTAFEAQFTAFTSDPGRAGIEAFYQAMVNDKAQAETEAAATRFAAATDLYKRSQPQWATETQRAVDYVAYNAKLVAIKPPMDALRPKPAAANGLAQADTLIATAGKQALALDYATALATLVEAEKRVADGKAAADAADKLGALKDTAALDGMATDYAKAHKVFTDMRAEVASADSTGNLSSEIAKADPMAAAAQAAATKAPPDFTEARKQLDAAIAHLEATMPKAIAWVPYRNHLSAVKMMVNMNLPGINSDNCIQAQITEAQTLMTTADTLGSAPTFDIAGAEKLLTQAKVITDQAQVDANLYRGSVQADVATITGIKGQLASAANADVVAFMGTRVARIDKYLGDIQADIAARKMADAAKKGTAGAALKLPTNDEITDGKEALHRKKDWYDVNLLAVNGKPECAPLIASAAELLKIYTADMAKPSFLSAQESVSTANEELRAAIRVRDAFAAYEPKRQAAETALNTVRAVRNPGVEADLVALEARYNAAPALVAATNFHRATIEMDEITKACPDLVTKANGFKPYEDARVPAKAKMDEAAKHPQAAAIQPMIQRLTAKYGQAETVAKGGDYVAAKTLMDEILSDAEEAIKSADNHAIMDSAAAALDKAADVGVLEPAVIMAVQKVLDYLNGRPEKVGAAAELATATAQLAIANAGVGATKAALKAAIAACDSADEKMSQYRMLEKSVTRAKAQVTALKAHAQAAYVDELLKPVSAVIDKTLPDAQASGDHIKAGTALDAEVVKLIDIQAKADAYARYLTVKDEPAVTPMVEVLEKHTARYAIKPSIDTMRAKLEEARSKADDKKPDEALKLLEEVRNIGASAMIMAKMRDNVPPTTDEVKALLARPGGEAELDAMMANLEEDAQRAVLRVAFEARYGVKLNIYTYNAVADTHTLDVVDGGKIGPNIKRFYELMSKLPPGDTTGNDSMLIWSDKQAGGSKYSSRNKDVIMNEGQDEFSGYYGFGRDFEVGGQEEDCKPTDMEPVNRFSWNTLHEVGHAVDDQHSYMKTHQSEAKHGGWIVHGSDYGAVAKVFADFYGYDQVYVEQVMRKAPNPAIPDIPAGKAITPEEWEKKRIAVTNHVNMAIEAVKPWTSNSHAARIAINNRVYQESYPDTWTSYDAGARKQGMTGYQFRAPGEWFSELYAAYHVGKMKPTHPAVEWLKPLGEPKP